MNFSEKEKKNKGKEWGEILFFSFASALLHFLILLFFPALFGIGNEIVELYSYKKIFFWLGLGTVRIPIWAEPLVFMPIYFSFFWLYQKEKISLVKKMYFFQKIWRRRVENRYNFILSILALLFSFFFGGLTAIIWYLDVNIAFKILVSLYFFVFLARFSKIAFSLLFLLISFSFFCKNLMYYLSFSIIIFFILYLIFCFFVLIFKKIKKNKNKDERMKQFSSYYM